ncbi:MAG TPA: hypothetical protein PKA63_03165 [Oligoflexia bacterium]|nr:hypothetical protein [Oligoflexia bacterium]
MFWDADFLHLSAGKRLLLFLVSIIISAIIFLTLYVSSSSYMRLDDGSLAYLLEQVRTRTLKENTGSELRKIGINSERLDKKIFRLVDILSVPSETGNLSISQRREILNVIGQSGRASLSLTGVLLPFVAAEEEDMSVRKEAILALKRIRSVRESIQDVLIPLCENSTTNNLTDGILDGSGLRFGIYACALIVERGGEISSEKENELAAAIRYLESDISKIPTADTEVTLDFTNPGLFFDLSMLGYRVEGVVPRLRNAFSHSVDNEIRVKLVQVLRDVVHEDDYETMQFISDIMQYDSEYRVREAALLVLIGLNSESSIKLAKSYGHKFLRGDIRPSRQEPHPFRKWALKKLKETEALADLKD